MIGRCPNAIGAEIANPSANWKQVSVVSLKIKLEELVNN